MTNKLIKPSNLASFNNAYRLAVTMTEQTGIEHTIIATFSSIQPYKVIPARNTKAALIRYII